MMLSAHKLTKHYGIDLERQAVRGVDIAVAPGEFVTIIGRSGSGKSTLLAMIGALTKPTSGTVTLDGNDIWSMSEAERSAFRATQIGFVFQFPSLLSNLRAVDNVALPAVFAGSMDMGAAYTRALELLDSVGLADHTQSYPGQMSGGEQRRVVIARALINSPRFLLADEPTSDLDEDTEADIIELLDQLRKKMSVGLIVVVHDLTIAKRADHIYEMRQGILLSAKIEKSTLLESPRLREFGPAVISISSKRIEEKTASHEARQLGSSFHKSARSFLVAAAIAFMLVLATDYATGRYQAMRLHSIEEKRAALETMALSGLRSDIESVSDLGDGRYEVALYLWNTDTAQPIYVMLSGVQAYVQVATQWEEIPLHATDENAQSVLKITGKQLYHYTVEARATNYAQLLPHYMHVRFVNAMLISPQSTPIDDLFERKDSYYIYLKPSNMEDNTILKDMKFDGKPPVWIPMPPH